MTKKGGSLTFPANPLAAMQELSELDAPRGSTGKETIADNTYTDTDLRNEVSNDLSKELSNDYSEQSPSSENTPRPATARRPRRSPPPAIARVTPALPASSAPPASLSSQTARQRLLAQTEKEAVTRLSIDVPMSLYNRIKQYIAVNNVESIRALTLALYEDFLTEEQF